MRFEILLDLSMKKIHDNNKGISNNSSFRSKEINEPLIQEIIYCITMFILTFLHRF